MGPQLNKRFFVLPRVYILPESAVNVYAQEKNFLKVNLFIILLSKSRNHSNILPLVIEYHDKIFTFLLYWHCYASKSTRMNKIEMKPVYDGKIFFEMGIS